MAVPGGVNGGRASGLFTIAEEIPARVRLLSAPDAHLFSTFVVTWSAARALSRIDTLQAERPGNVFWIGGAAGTGKTHFLNYLLGFEQGTAPGEGSGRRIAFTVGLADSAHSERLESRVLESMGHALAGGDPHPAINWHGARGGDAISLAMGQARRVGIRAISGFIDLAGAETIPLEYFEAIAQCAASSRHVRLTIFIASRIAAPDFAVALDIAPEDEAEKIRTAIARARTLRDGAEDAATEVYRACGLELNNPTAIYPFHPETIDILHALADPPATVAALASLARGAMAAANHGELIFPCDVIAAPTIREIVHRRIGESAWNAVEIARDRIRSLHPHEGQAGEEIAAALALSRAATGQSAIAIDRLERILPSLARGVVSASEVVRRLPEASGGVIRLEGEMLVLDPGAARAPTLAAFNSALALVKRFAPEIAHPSDAEHIGAAEARLSEAMSQAAEKAAHTEEVLRSALAANNLAFPEEQRNAIAKYIEFASAGARALEEAGSDRTLLEARMRIISEYEALAGAAEFVSQMRAMREYLERTGLGPRYEEPPAGDPALSAMETESQLLAAELTPRILLHPPRNLDALRARFQKFRWSYVAAYQAAHTAWREQMRRAAALAENLRLHAAALKRLNSIVALGEEEGAGSLADAAAFSAPIAPCETEAPLAIELVPRCSGCGYVLGAKSPNAEIVDLTERIKAAIARKLTALSRSAIARIIREHDRAGRLEGFLKITQAAHTDALLRVLDDKLARYLARLLDENLSESPRRPSTSLFGEGGASAGHKRRAAHEGARRPRNHRR